MNEKFPFDALSLEESCLDVVNHELCLKSLENYHEKSYKYCRGVEADKLIVVDFWDIK